jgi:hypothetical protein
MLDMTDGVGPPDQHYDAADEPQKKQKSQRIEPIGFAVPAMSPASHQSLPLASPGLVRDHIENEGSA